MAPAPEQEINGMRERDWLQAKIAWLDFEADFHSFNNGEHFRQLAAALQRRLNAIKAMDGEE